MRKLLDHAADQYVTVTFAARLTGRPHRTIRTWALTGLVRVRRVDDTLLVHAADTAKQSATRARRSRSRNDHQMCLNHLGVTRHARKQKMAPQERSLPEARSDCQGVEREGR